MSKQEQQIRSLQAQLRDVQAFLGVLTPVFEREYKRGKWDWTEKPRKTKKSR